MEGGHRARAGGHHAAGDEHGEEHHGACGGDDTCHCASAPVQPLEVAKDGATQSSESLAALAHPPLLAWIELVPKTDWVHPPGGPVPRPSRPLFVLNCTYLR